jgi:hypothetical protein
MRGAWLALVLVFASVAWSAEAKKPTPPANHTSYEQLSETQQMYVDRMVEHQKEIIPTLQKIIKNIDADLARLGQDFNRLRGAERSVRRQAIQDGYARKREIQEKIDRMVERQRRGEPPEIVLECSWTIPSIGEAGTCTSSVRIRQIVGRDEMLCELGVEDNGHNLFYIKGVSTFGKTNGMAIKPPPVVFVGTKTYTTPSGGSNTVFYAEAVDTDGLRPIIEERVIAGTKVAGR